ncbi:mRNA export factor GLE1 [Culicoides brevitarsis]|uniref:mRNA export factor GLE1 n=1 Tax=Culicoides brevitarsis TaxID=469753 RepID=UPI00307BBA46
MVDILALRRETKISQLLKSEGAFSHEHQIPGWQNLLLCEKLPMYKFPFKVNFSRNVVGKKLWRNHPYDIRSISYNFGYDALHDPHLRKFFNKSINNERLQFHSLTDKDTDGVLCDLKTFNNFRKYLFELFLIEIHRKMKEIDRIEKQRLILRKIEDKIYKSELKQSYQRSHEEILKEIQEERHKRLQSLQHKFKQTISMHETKKLNLFTEFRVRAFHRSNLIRCRLSIQREKQRRRRINLILRFQAKFRHHQNVLQNRLVNKQQDKLRKVRERWHAILAFRENYNNKREILLAENEREMQRNVERRKEKLEKAKQRMNEKFMQYKAAQVRKRYKHFHKENVKKAMRNGMMSKMRRLQKKKRAKREKSLFSIENDEFTSKDKLIVIAEPKEIESSEVMSNRESFYSITKSKNKSYTNSSFEEIPSQEEKIDRNTINAAVDKAFEAFEFLKSIQNNLSIIEIAKEIIEIFIQTPDNILPFDDAVIQYAQLRARSTMESVKDEVMQEVQSIIIANKDVLCGKSKSSSTVKSKSKSVVFDEKLNSVSIETLSSEVTFKSVKNRVPTPTTSLHDLVSITLEAENEDPEIPEESNTLELIHLSKGQKLLMERNCVLFRKLLKQSVLQRCLAAIDLTTMMIATKVNENLIGIDIEYLIEVVGESLVRLPTEDLQFGSNLLLATNVLSTQVLLELRVTLYEMCGCREVSCLTCLQSFSLSENKSLVD